MLAVCGLVVNVMIGRFYSPSVLGSFNQVFSIFIIGSQLAVLGVQFSVLKACAEFEDDHSVIIVSAVIIVLVLGLIVGTAVYISRGVVAQLLGSPGVAFGMLLISPGILLFGLNKIFVNAINGMGRLKTFAVLQSLRPIVLIIAMAVFCYMGLKGHILGLALTIAELGVFVGALSVVGKEFFRSFRGSELRIWIRRHFRFGLDSAVGGTLGEMNTRVDVLCLGLFMSDRTVGISSLAAMITEGLMHIPLVIRRVCNPIIVNGISQKERVKLSRFVRKIGARTWYLMAVLITFAGLAFPVLVSILTGNDDFKEGQWIFLILASGLFIVSGVLPFNQLFLMGGHPGHHSKLILAITVTNVLFNLILIPGLGVSGAAIGTVIAWVVGAGIVAIAGTRNYGFQWKG